MRKFYFIVSCLLITGLSYGQLIPEHMQHGLQSNPIVKTMKMNFDKTDNDTIGWNTGMPLFCSPVCSLYVYSLTSNDVKVGYWFGTNFFATDNYSLSFWAQCYLNETPVKIIGALAIIAGKVNLSNNANSKLEVSLYKMAADQTLIGGSSPDYVKGTGPAYYGGTPLGIATKSIIDLDTVWNPNLGLNFFPFSQPSTLSEDFAIVSNFTSLVENGDTAYMYCDEPGNGLGMHYAQYSRDPSQYYWLSTDFGSGGALNINIPLFAVVDNSSAGIDAHSFFQGMKMSVFPNPVADFVQIDYALQYNSEASLQIINLNGELVKTLQLGYKTAGKYSQTLDISNLAPGNYLFSLNANGTRLIKQISVQ